MFGMPRGRKFIDGIGGLWFANVGFGRQELIDAAAKQLAELPQYSYFTDLGNPPAAQLAAKLAELTPRGPQPCLLQHRRLRRQRHRRAHRPLLLQQPGQAVQAAIHLPAQRLPRQHLSKRRPVRQDERQARLPQPGRTGALPVRPQLLPDAARQQWRSGLLRPSSGGVRGQGGRTRRGPHRRLLRRADHGGRRGFGGAGRLHHSA